MSLILRFLADPRFVFLVMLGVLLGFAIYDHVTTRREEERERQRDAEWRRQRAIWDLEEDERIRRNIEARWQRDQRHQEALRQARLSMQQTWGDYYSLNDGEPKCQA